MQDQVASFTERGLKCVASYGTADCTENEGVIAGGDIQLVFAGQQSYDSHVALRNFHTNADSAQRGWLSSLRAATGGMGGW